MLSERGRPLTRQAMSYLVGLAPQRASLPRGPHAHAPPLLWLLPGQTIRFMLGLTGEKSYLFVSVASAAMKMRI